ncbi:hypothetical protein HYR69_07630 [Candidatus Sumerlaeota bacterium]|nr:hypothetical protein [Candidatus Sumerlaeota bacterium]
MTGGLDRIGKLVSKARNVDRQKIFILWITTLALSGFIIGYMMRTERNVLSWLAILGLSGFIIGYLMWMTGNALRKSRPKSREKSFAEVLSAPYSLPRVEELKPPPQERIVELCKMVFAKGNWILLQNGTCLTAADPPSGVSAESIDQVFEDWKKSGYGSKDEGSAWELKNNLGWLVSSGDKRISSLILKDELEPDPNPLRATMLAIIKRSADLARPRVIHRKVAD